MLAWPTCLFVLIGIVAAVLAATITVRYLRSRSAVSGGSSSEGRAHEPGDDVRVLLDAYIGTIRIELRKAKDGSVPVVPTYAPRAYFKSQGISVLKITEAEVAWIRSHGGDADCAVPSMEIMNILKREVGL